LDINIDKNRWENILAYDETRVKLKPIDGVEGSDYINANWISDLQGNKEAYICTQGPKDFTVADFWRMTFENKINVIVMLTRLIEDGVEKCAQYWPSHLNEEVNYSGIKLTLLKEETQANIIIRELNITMGGESSQCTQIQFTAWPDHGVPPESDYIFLSDKTDELNVAKRPILVHCSAGVGRSGTFCTVSSYIHYLRGYVKERGKLPRMSIAKAVYNLRKERASMVQSGDQYEFIYKTIFKEFTTMENDIKQGKYPKPPSNPNPTTNPNPNAQDPITNTDSKPPETNANTDSKPPETKDSNPPIQLHTNEQANTDSKNDKK